MIAYRPERFTHALNEILPMIDAHWEEVGSFKDEFTRSIDIEAYIELERQGRLLTVTARDDGRLAGYFVGVIGNDLHRKDKRTLARIKICSWLVYFIDPKYRGYALAFTRSAEREAAALGCQIVNTRVKPGLNGADAFFLKIGYSETERTLTRLIGDAAHASDRSAVD